MAALYGIINGSGAACKDVERAAG